MTSPRGLALVVLALLLGTWGATATPASEVPSSVAGPSGASGQSEGAAGKIGALAGGDPAVSVPAGSVIAPAPSPSDAPGATADAMSPATATTPEGWTVVAADGPLVGDAGRRVTYTVEVEPATGWPVAEVLATVETALLDPERGWTAAGRWSLQRVGAPEAADIRVVLAMPVTVDRHCARVGLRTVGRYSCWDGGRAMLNLRRWEEGAADFVDVTVYRRYQVNHEVGHGLGLRHVACPGPGEPAPVMMQQTKSTDGCVPNGWPFPAS